jgi:TfoX/Sxy family transcriptional regulator of competence genes
MGGVGLFHAAVMLMLVSRRFTALGACVEEAL